MFSCVEQALCLGELKRFHVSGQQAHFIAFFRRNCPTQAKERLEWAPGSPAQRHKVPPLRFAPVGMTELFRQIPRFARDDMCHGVGRVAGRHVAFLFCIALKLLIIWMLLLH
jgi:hypothetical protein